MNILDDDFDEKLIRACRSSAYQPSFSQLLAVPAQHQTLSQSTLSQLTSVNNINSNNNHNSNEQLDDLLKDVDQSAIDDFLMKRIELSKPIFDYLKSILKAYQQHQQIILQQQNQDNEDNDDDQPSNSSSSLKFTRANIICNFLQVIIESNHSNHINEKDLIQCIDLILSECDSLEVRELQDIISLITKHVETNTKSPIYLLLAKCMMLRGQLKSNDSSNNEEHMEYQTNTITSIVSSNWPKQTFITIIESLNDLPLSKKHLEDIINKIKDDLPSIGYPDLPSVSHQLLLLSSQGLKGMILKVICDHFVQEETTKNPGNEQLMMIESTVILQISFAIKQDMDIGKEFEVSEDSVRKYCSSCSLYMRIVTRTTSRQAGESSQRSQAALSSSSSLAPVNKHSFELLRDVFNKFAKEMISTEFSEYREISSKSETSKTCAGLLMGVIESLIEYAVTKVSLTNTNDKFVTILKLFAVYTHAKSEVNSDANQTKSGKGGKKGGGSKKRKIDEDEDEFDPDEEMKDVGASKPKSKSGASKGSSANSKELLKSTLSSECIKELFNFMKSIDTSQMKLQEHDKYDSFSHFIYQSCLEYLTKMFVESKQYLDTHIESANPSENIVKQNLNFCRAVLPHLNHGLNKGGWEEPKLNSKIIPTHTLILSCLDLIFKFIKDFGTEKNLGTCLTNDPLPKPKQIEDAIKSEIKRLEDVCQDTAIAHAFWGDADIIIAILSKLYPYLPERDIPQHHQFIQSLYQIEMKVTSPTFAATVVRTLLELSNIDNDTMNIVNDIANHLIHSEADQEEDIDVDDDDNLEPRILNRKTHIQVEAEFFKHINSEIDKSRDLIVQLKKDWTPNLTENAEIKLNRMRNRIYDSLCLSCQAMDKLARDVTPYQFSPQSSDKLLKTLKKLFTILTTLKDGLSRSEKARIYREAKFLPLLAFTLEKYEATVIRYEKKLNIKERLGQHFKKAEIRDFKIDKEQLRRLEENAEDEEEKQKPKKKKSAPKPKATVVKKKTQTKKKPTAPKGRLTSKRGGSRGGATRRRGRNDEDEEGEDEDQYNNDDDEDDDNNNYDD
ncbi:hypothetical protein PPL_03787 [Heterostelium album PN500]|uniref:Uncharacterized protein n=1 Tax=Heterostelium pallidum (strain ATCC 26659 / Pp 5 / PN500) TaxID=670386 RepID=D3B6N6_HETP5|nr:hypothetical protein PPL_03787 [Heterostelium album PN500]EFA83006.1 hypothetical protein PPL_03787 [Heterostelium album PN500]|eukprot:XP_020435123.1 hypothetical protein PPL_03787 [Heterostelium album PN500]